MEQSKMLKAINEYCDKQCDCPYGYGCHDCLIRTFCWQCFGNFKDNPKLTKEAYDLITNKAVENDVINHPSHYANGGMECIDEMELIFGKQAVMNFCLCNAWKYRKRAMYKNGEEDMKKSDWYINKYKELSAV